MNILLVTMEMQVGGAETHVFELARELKKRNNNVYVMSAGGKYACMLQAEGIVHISAPLKNKNPINMIKSYNTIASVIKEKDIEVVHAHARIPAFISAKVCKKLNIPIVTTVHGIYKVNFILKKLTNWGQKSLAVSEDIKKELIEDYGLNPENIGITVNGINVDKFCKGINEDIIQELGIDSDKFRIIHVSRFDKDSSNVAKMLISSIDDFKRFTSDRCQLILVGSGDYFEELKKLAGPEKDIIMTGLRTDVSELLKCSDLFVGVSRSALEAMSCELPVILAGNEAYNQGFIGIFDENNTKQAILTNFCCRDCKRLTKQDLLENVEAVYRMDEKGRQLLGKYGRNIVIQNYSISKMVDDAENMYNSVYTF